MYRYHRFGLYLIFISVVCQMSFTMETKITEEVLGSIAGESHLLPNPVACVLEIEQVRRVYDQRSLGQKIFGTAEEARLWALRAQKIRNKKEQPNYYLTIKDAADFSVDKNIWRCIVSTNHGQQNPQSGSLLRGFRAIPTEIWRGVSKIDLSHGSLEVLPLHKFVQFCPHLVKLIADNNKIKSIAYTSNPGHTNTKVHSLETFKVPHNELTEFDFDALFKVFPEIKYIDLSHNQNLQKMILENVVASTSSVVVDSSEMLLAHAGGIYKHVYTLPTINVVDTLLSTTTHRNHFRRAYVQTLCQLNSTPISMLPLLSWRHHLITQQEIKAFEERAAQQIIYEE
jgi:hypothetical protein